MKKVLMLFIACCLILNSAVMCVFAARQDVDYSVELTRDIIYDAGERIAELSASDRATAFNVSRAYLSTDVGIDSLIEIIEEESFESNPTVSNLYTIVGDKDLFVLMLKLIKCIDEDDRAEVLDKFYAREELELSKTKKNELDDVFEFFASENVITKIEEENSVTAGTIVLLFTALEDKIMFTDTKYGSSDFALENISSSFSREIGNVLADYTLNGKTYNAKTFVNMILDAINDEFPKDIKNKIKNIFEEVGIYTPVKKPTTTSSGNSGFTVITDNYYGKTVPSEYVAAETILGQYAASGVVAPTFDDAANHWSENVLRVLRSKAIIAGDGNTNNFRPDDRISREEMAVIIARYLTARDGVDVSTYEHVKFTDSNNVSEWAVSSVSYLATKGIILGYPDGDYRPKQEITREEAVAIIARVLGNKYIPQYDAPVYSDSADIGEWAKTHVDYTSDLKIVNGYTTGEFLPKNYVTRAEVAVLVYNKMCVEGMMK